MSPAYDPLSAGIIGRSAAIVKLTRTIAKVAASHANVLIEGESGTGKELVARAIHMTSPLPVPLSPSMRTLAWDAATFAMVRVSLTMAALRPMMPADNGSYAGVMSMVHL